METFITVVFVICILGIFFSFYMMNRNEKVGGLQLALSELSYNVLLSYLHDNVPRKPTISMAGGIGTRLLLLNIILIYRNIRFFCKKTKKIVNLTIFSRLHTIYVCDFTK